MRTFITATAGIGRMDFRKYIVFSAVGGFLWAVGFTLAGYFLGNIEFVKKNLEFIVILVVFVSVVPIVFETSSTAVRGRAWIAPAACSDALRHPQALRGASSA